MAKNQANETAEQKIDEAVRTGATELSLAGGHGGDVPKLTEVPQSITQLRDLVSLNLSNNALTSLPDWIGHFTHLKTLKVSNNRITVIPEAICALQNLETFDLQSNQLATLPDGLSRLSQLRSLRLSHNMLEALPERLAGLAQLESLYLDSNSLNELPDSLGDLRRLRVLHLSHNELSLLPSSLSGLSGLEELELWNIAPASLPKWLGDLARVTLLNVNENGLTHVPEWLRNLRSLRALHIWGNPITDIPSFVADFAGLSTFTFNSAAVTEVPDGLFDLRQLDRLDLSGFETLACLSPRIGRLTNLKRLFVTNSQVAELPEEIGNLTKLHQLVLAKNQIADLPQSLLRLHELEVLDLDDNPLNPTLRAAYAQGIDAVSRYLQELAKGTTTRYEAKLLILGDGNEGKTCVSRAIRNLPFEPQVTTRGVDVEQWQFPHPDRPDVAEDRITLNIWDFEGQEINHQTHQFFLSNQALYVLVFRCRDQFLMDRAEYWLDTIRARAPRARVAMVVTQCEERTPYVPQERLRAQYGDLLVDEEWLFPVGCKDDLGVPELQSFLRRSAADLEFMGQEWPASFAKAETAVKATAASGVSHITRTELHAIFRHAGIEETLFRDLSRSMSLLGIITEFFDSPDLRNFIVLQPQWLTKAISEIMEDRQLTADKGEIALSRMEDIWNSRGYTGLFSAFHNCMKEFELCYDLEDASRSCLVPLRFGFKKPDIPWSPQQAAKTRRVEYTLKMRPPTGLMSRFIVKTHHMIVRTTDQPKGVYWHNGVFLRTGAGVLTSEALCEFDDDSRKVRVEVRAAFPQNLLEQIHAYVKAVFSFFSGLEAERSYGCVKFNEDAVLEEACHGVHSERRIYSAIRNQRVLDCEHEFHDVDPQKLIFGFSSFGEYVLTKVASIAELRKELDRRPAWAGTLIHDISRLLDWVANNSHRLEQLQHAQQNLLPALRQEAELKLHEYLMYMSQMLDDRDHTAAPGLISITKRDRSKWNPTSYFKENYILTPFCECEGNIHAVDDAKVEFAKDRDWWLATAPWVARGTKILSAGLQLAFAGMPLALGKDVFETIKDDVDFMNELAKHVELEGGAAEPPLAADEVLQGDVGKDMRGRDREARLTRAAVSRLLDSIAPTNYRAKQWGSLHRVRMSDNSYRWLCERHAP